MQILKPYIAVIFLTVFLTKNTLVDAKLLVVFMSSNDITFVNPFCKKVQSENSEDKQFVSQDSQTTVIPFSAFCTPQFQFETLITDIPFNDQFYPDNKFMSPKTYQVFNEPNFPPPKV